VSNDRIISELWIGINVEGSGRGLMSVASLYLSRRTDGIQQEHFYRDDRQGAGVVCALFDSYSDEY
jgi:hypothetical protein